MRELLRKLRFLLQRDRFERELDEEMRHHLAMKAEERDSAEAANRQFGNVTLLKEESRTVWTWTFWEQTNQDLRYGLGTMAGNPLFTAMAVLSLALGIGANSAIYSFMDAIMMRALPVRHPEELVVINWRAKDRPAVIHGMNGSQHRDKAGIASPNYPFAAYEGFHANQETLSTLFGLASSSVPVSNVNTQAAQIDQTISQERTFAELCTCFAILALTIACVGLYGTMAYAMARRTHEIGIRMALGAERRKIVRMILGEVLALAAVGLGIGLAAAWGTTHFVASILFGIKPNDPVAISISVAVLVVAAIVASYAPASRASRIDTTAALRHE